MPPILSLNSGGGDDIVNILATPAAQTSLNLGAGGHGCPRHAATAGTAPARWPAFGSITAPVAAENIIIDNSADTVNRV